jgi:hypothetical protein
MSRERKRPSQFASSFAYDEGEFNKLIRDYQHNKPNPAKAKVAAAVVAKVVPTGKATTEGKTTSKGVKNSKNASYKSKTQQIAAATLTPQGRIQDELEEKHIALYRERKNKGLRSKKVLPEGAEELPDITAAIKKGVKECSVLPLNWALPKIKMIGHTCKVYWDGEDTWFYARIINYDSFYDRHYVSIFSLHNTTMDTLRANCSFSSLYLYLCISLPPFLK